MTESILDSTKKTLGISADYTAFDVDILMYINSAFATLNQLGVGPAEGFMIQDSSLTWDIFTLNDVRLNFVKQYISYRVRVAFDPPQTAHLLASLNEQIRELEWRLNVLVDPTTTTTLVYDGGVP